MNWEEINKLARLINAPTSSSATGIEALLRQKGVEVGSDDYHFVVECAHNRANTGYTIQTDFPEYIPRYVEDNCVLRSTEHTDPCGFGGDVVGQVLEVGVETLTVECCRDGQSIEWAEHVWIETRPKEDYTLCNWRN